MKRVPLLVLLLLLLHQLSAQPTFSYDAAWKKVTELAEEKGLTESALREVQRIYEAARAAGNQPQLIKALVYRIRLQQRREEDADVKAIRELDQEIANSPEPARSLLNSLLAGAYWNYLQQNRYLLHNRTNTTGFEKTDIRTWTSEDLHRKIAALFHASLQERILLQQTNIETFDPVLQQGNMRHLRPTLFDLLAHRALAYYRSDDHSLTRPADAFEISTASAYDPAADFVTRRFPTTDTNSLHHRALLLYQELLQFRLNNSNTPALVDADLDRLVFVNSRSTHPDKRALYRQSLQHLWHQYATQPLVAQAAYLLAQDYADEAATYDYRQHKEGSTTNPRYRYQEAVTICRQVVAQADSSEGKFNCFNLLQQIEQKDLRLRLEKVNLPQQPLRALVTYRNVPQAWFRVVRISAGGRDSLEGRSYDPSYWKRLTALPAVQQFQHALPATGDYQQHHTEIAVNKLPAGTYLLLASTTADFSTSNNLLAAGYFHVSNIAWMEEGHQLFVVHRESGQPLPGARVTVWEQQYDYNSSRYVSVKGKTFTTNVNGFVLLPDNSSYNRYSRTLEVSYEAETLHLDDRANSYVYRPGKPDTDEARNRQTFLFTDRSLYRPGQTVYFKGLVTTRTTANGRYRTVPRFQTMVYLYDVNYQRVDSLQVTSNAFGSYAGTFLLPVNRVNGQYRLVEADKQQAAAFSVEEYKRPKFYVEYKPVEQSYHLNSEVTVTGNALAYAGNAVDGAIVRYRVVRKARLPYPWLCWRWGWPELRSQEISQGETRTRADGSFDVRFTAQPDNQVARELDPVFDFEIAAEVTDLNGETRSGTTRLSAGYKQLDLQLQLPLGESMPADSLTHLLVFTRNQMGVHVPAQVTIVLHRLAAPDRLLRDRYWETPDQFVLSEAAFRKQFPYDPYKDEQEKESWSRTGLFLEQTDSSRSNGRFDLRTTAKKPFAPGWYVLEARATDAAGQPVVNRLYVELTRQGVPATPRYTWKLPDYTTAQPGETVYLGFGSSAAQVHVVEIADSSDSSRIRFHRLNNEHKATTVSITETDRGGLGFSYAFVKHNRLFRFNRSVAVPWTNKELSIRLETFRNKTLPGSQEEWKVVISGQKGEQVAAELLTALYDASLDQFKPHSWSKPNLYPVHRLQEKWVSGGFGTSESRNKNFYPDENRYVEKTYDELNDIESYGRYQTLRYAAAPPAGAAPVAEDNQRKDVLQETVVTGYGKDSTAAITRQDTKAGLQIRKDFRETAFFFPQLQTDSAGSITLRFTMPEALTRWKWLLMAHTQDLALGLQETTLVTQKDLMVQPFAPRFLREGDRFSFTAKISNLTERELTGTTQLQLLNATTLQPVDGWFQNVFAIQHFTVEAGQSAMVEFRTEVPYNFNEALTYRITAQAGNLSDGEEATLPVLTNRMLVTESIPLTMNAPGTRTYRFNKLLESGKSPTLSHHRFTVEFTTNPAWYAVQALPFLAEYPYPSAEQHWNRFYANALALYITKQMPRIRSVLEQWQQKDTAALLSNLQKNEELKAVLLQETPWVLQAKSEEQQKKNLALLFNLVRMSRELNNSLEQLLEMQAPNGGFVWFAGGPDDRYITQYIVTGIGHLKQLGAWPSEQVPVLNRMLDKAIPYLDGYLKKDYEDLLRSKAKLSQPHLGPTQIQYLYLRSFFRDRPQTAGTGTALTFYTRQSRQYWLRQGKYLQGMIALSLHRAHDAKTAQGIVRSLRENALVNEELGMYWKEWNTGYYWYEAPVQAQSLLIEVFSEIGRDPLSVSRMKTWLLRQKQTQQWRSTVATADACYALLLQGDDWLGNEQWVEVKAGRQQFSSRSEKTEAGTGYFKRALEGDQVTPELGNLELRLQREATAGNRVQPAWGAAYWQYFENLDQITASATPLQLQKKYFIEQNTPNGPILMPLEEETVLRVGDRIKVRVELRVDRMLEYVHMKDLRPSCLEPVQVLSNYKWQGGLGFYESTRDAATDFFFGRLPRGTYVFEYPLRVTHAGNYSSGITTIQCLYAPEFTSHSEGIRLRVEQQP